MLAVMPRLNASHLAGGAGYFLLRQTLCCVTESFRVDVPGNLSKHFKFHALSSFAQLPVAITVEFIHFVSSYLHVRCHVAQLHADNETCDLFVL